MTSRILAAGSRDAIDTHRLEAFSDGVMAVIITIMAFQLETPVAARSTTCRHGCRPPRLRPQLHRHRHLLEQPPPPPAGDQAHRRCGDVDEPLPPLLAVAGPLRHRMGGHRPRRVAARRHLRGGGVGGRPRLLRPGAGHPSGQPRRRSHHVGPGAGLQGHRLAGHLRCRHRVGPAQSLPLVRLLAAVSFLWLVPDRRWPGPDDPGPSRTADAGREETLPPGRRREEAGEGGRYRPPTAVRW